MTVVFSAASADWVVVAADSAVTRDFDDSSREYDVDRKMWPLAGLGVVATWGARNANLIGRFLDAHWSDPRERTVKDLATAVHRYLTEEYRPADLGQPDIGYHIAGFLPAGTPALFHSYFENPPDDSRTAFYDFQELCPTDGTKQFLYNGRNDLAHAVIDLVLNQLRMGRATRFQVETHADAVYLAHFLLRVASEITPEVGPPFRIHVSLPDGFFRTLSYGIERVPVQQFALDYSTTVA